MNSPCGCEGIKFKQNFTFNSVYKLSLKDIDDILLV